MLVNIHKLSIFEELKTPFDHLLKLFQKILEESKSTFISLSISILKLVRLRNIYPLKNNPNVVALPQFKTSQLSSIVVNFQTLREKRSFHLPIVSTICEILTLQIVMIICFSYDCMKGKTLTSLINIDNQSKQIYLNLF